MGRFLAGSINNYRVYEEVANNGIARLDDSTYTDSEVDCKIVSRTETMYNRSRAPVENSSTIQVRLTFQPFLGSTVRLPDRIEYNGEWYTFYSIKDPGKVMPHYICYAYLPTGVSYG